MKYLLLPLLFFSTRAWSQDFLRDFQAITEQIGQNEVDHYLKNPTPEGLPGPILSSLMPSRTIDPETACEEEGESKKTHYEVVLIAEGSSETADLEILPGQTAVLSTSQLRELLYYSPKSDESSGLQKDAILQRAQELWQGSNHKSSINFDPNSAIGRELVIESLIHASANSTLSENDLSRQIAGVLSNVYTTPDERYDALSALSLRLYRNYNTARNPGYDNPNNNPFDYDLPAGDISMNEFMKAAADFNVFGGGVCNDISEVVAQVGEHLFPDKDVLTVNSGSHFGVLITDGNETRVIDGGTQYNMEGQLLLDPTFGSTNLRISKVVNGEQREIAVVDTQMGQIAEAAFETGKTLLKTDADISSMVVHLKKNNFGVSVATGKLASSNVVIVVAKYENAGEKWKSYSGIGLSAQDFSNGVDTKYQVHFRSGLERNMFRYVNARTEVNFATGARLGGMYTLGDSSQTFGANSIDFSASLDIYNRLDVNYGRHNPNGVQLNSSLEVEHTVGPRNWGNTTGALSYMSPRDTGSILKNMSLHLNQINADVNVEKAINSQVTGFSNVHYQGSNIGQSVSVTAGLNIQAPQGAQILVFTGYSKADIRGFKTQHSLLGEDTGEQVGVKYIGPSGIEISGSARNISSEPSFQGTIKVPLGRKKKK